MFAYLHDLRALAGDERCVTALEYGLIAGLIAVAIVTAVTNLGTTLLGVFTTITADL
jgi:pilus assembly protein Flp/PilA